MVPGWLTVQEGVGAGTQKVVSKTPINVEVTCCDQNIVVASCCFMSWKCTWGWEESDCMAAELKITEVKSRKKNKKIVMSPFTPPFTGGQQSVYELYMNFTINQQQVCILITSNHAHDKILTKINISFKSTKAGEAMLYCSVLITLCGWLIQPAVLICYQSDFKDSYLKIGRTTFVFFKEPVWCTVGNKQKVSVPYWKKVIMVL